MDFILDTITADKSVSNLKAVELVAVLL